MKKFVKILIVLVLAAAIYSLIPVASLYMMKEPEPYTNDRAVSRLAGNEGDNFEFIVLGDNHAGLIYNDSATLKLARHINKEDRFKKLPIDFVAVLGDVTLDGAEWDYKTYNKIRSLIKWPVVSAIGNHDDDRGGIKFFEKYIGKYEMAFADRNSYFIIADNISGDIDEEKFAWLEKELERSQAYAHRFVMLHKAPLSPYQQSWYRPELSPWSYKFMKLCEKYKVDMVLSGHEHMFKEGRYGGVTYITSGGGGMFIQVPESDGGFLHYVVVRVYGDYVDYEVRKIFPPLWEFLTYYMWKELLYFVKDVLY
ncbi:MAG: metallophosphoesterase [Candidatus Omnitrophica bacterium]|nr:metallophosphoesterase [Candidatus Omnitrophota bacterium]